MATTAAPAPKTRKSRATRASEKLTADIAGATSTESLTAALTAAADATAPAVESAPADPLLAVVAPNTTGKTTQPRKPAEPKPLTVSDQRLIVSDAMIVAIADLVSQWADDRVPVEFARETAAKLISYNPGPRICPLQSSPRAKRFAREAAEK